jgi:hypothetical protein
MVFGFEVYPSAASSLVSDVYKQLGEGADLELRKSLWKTDFTLGPSWSVEDGIKTVFYQLHSHPFSMTCPHRYFNRKDSPKPAYL